jgi:hypothetical protein
MIKHCIICGAEYKAPPSEHRSTCGHAKCVLERKRQSHVGKFNKWNDDSRQLKSAQGMTANLRQGTPAAKASPIAGAFETNQNALVWTIESPGGEIFEVRNLILWLRNPAVLLDGTPEQARAGICQIKRCMEGKTKRQVSQWKGWRLITWCKPQ